MLRRALTWAGGLAFAGALALSVTPAQAAVPLGDCGNDITWSIVNPARYGAEPHEAVVGLSDATRTVKIKVPTTCGLEAGDRWRVGNGYFSAEGTFNAEQAASGEDADVVQVEKPSSNSVAGDDINVKLKINDESAGTAGWEIDEGTAGDLNILRRTEFKYGSTKDRVNFSPEPYLNTVKARGKLIRADWSGNDYDSYAGRNVHIQTRTNSAGSTYGDVGETTTTSYGNVVFNFDVNAPGGPEDNADFIGRGRYFGNITSGGTVSTGDLVKSAE
jgi:hypothetical protein